MGDEVATPGAIRRELIEPLIQAIIGDHLACISAHCEIAVDQSDPTQIHDAQAHMVELIDRLSTLTTALRSLHVHIGPCTQCGIPQPSPGHHRVAPGPTQRLVYPTDCPTCGLYVESIDIAPADVNAFDQLFSMPLEVFSEQVITNDKIVVIKDRYIARPCDHELLPNDDGIIYKVEVK